MHDITECPHCGCEEFLPIGVLGPPPNWDTSCGTFCRGGTIHQSDCCRTLEIDRLRVMLKNVVQLDGLKELLEAEEEEPDQLDIEAIEDADYQWAILVAEIKEVLVHQVAEAKP